MIFNISRTNPSVASVYFALAVVIATPVTSALQTTACGWRVALNIGREPLTLMPPSWASSGARLPLVIKCDFTADGQVVSQKGEVRFTGPSGEVVKPVGKGEWSLRSNRFLSFTLNFPESLCKRDVELDAGTTVVCEGLVYSKGDLNAMNQRFYEARDKTDVVANDLIFSRQKQAPRVWDKEKGKWVERYSETKVLDATKRIKLFFLEGAEKREMSKRPNLTQLSLDSGPFPGVDGNVFVAKTGLVKSKKGPLNPVIGTWSAEPINDNPASYYRPSW